MKARIPLAEAQRIMQQVVDNTQGLYTKYSPVGSVRRKEKTIGDLDFLFEIRERDLQRFKQAVSTGSIIYSGGDKKLRLSNVMGSGREADVWIIYPPRNFYVMQALFTGQGHSQLFRKRLSYKGFRRPHGELGISSEEDLFQMAGIPFLPPELR